MGDTISFVIVSLRSGSNLLDFFITLSYPLQAAFLRTG